jgi:F-type H+-transporting ATPase subunit b
LKHFAAELAIGQAARQIAITPETDRALIAEFVSDAAKGGKN